MSTIIVLFSFFIMFRTVVVVFYSIIVAVIGRYKEAVQIPVDRVIAYTVNGQVHKSYTIRSSYDLYYTPPVVKAWKALSVDCYCGTDFCRLPKYCDDVFSYRVTGANKVVKLGYKFYEFKEFFKFIVYSVSAVNLGGYRVPVHREFVVYARNKFCCYVFYKRFFDGPVALYSNSTHIYFEDIPEKVLKQYFARTRFVPLDLTGTRLSVDFRCDNAGFARGPTSADLTYFTTNQVCTLDVFTDGRTKYCHNVSWDTAACPTINLTSLPWSGLLARYAVYIKH